MTLVHINKLARVNGGRLCSWYTFGRKTILKVCLCEGPSSWRNSQRRYTSNVQLYMNNPLMIMYNIMLEENH